MTPSNQKALLAGLLLFCVTTTASSQPSATLPIAGKPPIWDGRMTETEMHDLRRRAWALFEEVQNAGLPRSDRWFRSDDVYLVNASCGSASADRLRPTPLESPSVADESAMASLAEEQTAQELLAVNDQLTRAPDDPAAKAKRRVLVEETFFNAQACEDVRYGKLYARETRDDLLQQRRREIDEFRHGAKLIKTFWRPLPVDDQPVDVGIWQWPTPPVEPDPLTTLLESQWGRDECVQLNPPAGSTCLKAADSFPIAYYTKAEKFCEKCGLQEGQPLILIAVHVMSKSSPDWLWATFWWKGGPRGRTTGDSWTCDNAQRPETIRGVWKNFSANATESFNLARQPVAEMDKDECGKPGTIGSAKDKEEALAVYNPFVEGTLERGRKSSCIVCHARANTRSDDRVMRFYVPLPGMLDYPAFRELEGHIRTDYLWSVRRHLGLTDTRW